MPHYRRKSSMTQIISVRCIVHALCDALIFNRDILFISLIKRVSILWLPRPGIWICAVLSVAKTDVTFVWVLSNIPYILSIWNYNDALVCISLICGCFISVVSSNASERFWLCYGMTQNYRVTINITRARKQAENRLWFCESVYDEIEACCFIFLSSKCIILGDRVIWYGILGENWIVIFCLRLLFSLMAWCPFGKKP